MSQATPLKSPAERMQEMLAYLKLPFMRAQYEEVAQTAAKKSWTPLEYLRCLLEGEADLRNEHGVRHRVQMARFPVIKTLEQFDFTWPKKINRLQVQDLFRLSFVEKKANVLFLGGPGLGKTHLALALGHAACVGGFRVLFSTAVDIVNHLSAAQQAGRLATELARYQRPEVLVMDEVGYLPVDKRGADLLFQVIGNRYERGSIVLTTNKAFKDWSGIFYNDSTLASAILDRLLHHSETVTITGKSKRMQDQNEE